MSAVDQQSPALAIAHCHRCGAAVEKGDLRCAICGQTVPVEHEHRAETEVSILRCDGCGAAVSYDEKAQAPKCAFCDSVMHVEKIEDPMEQTGWWLSFAVPPEEARGALGPWFGGMGFLRPSDLRKTAQVEGLKPIWWVGWVFDARALVSWTADSDAGSRRSAWAPHSGQTELSFDRILVSASRGLSDSETGALISSYRLDQGAAQPHEHEGALIEQFDVQRSEARGKILDAAAATAASRVQAAHIPGSRFRNVRVELLLRGLTTKRCTFPAYVMAYRYRNKLYRAVVSGQDSNCVTGSAPYSVWKIAALILGVVGIIALIAVLIAS